MNVLKKLLLSCSLCVTAVIGADDSILSDDKRQLLQLQEQKAVYDADYLKKNWIEPVQLRYSRSENEDTDVTTTTKSVSISQPVFKSGGIYNAVKYADATRKSSYKSIESQRRDLISQALNLLYNYNKTRYQIQKQQLLIKNNEIEIQRKKEQYLAGLISSSDLDRAILDKNTNATQLLELKQSLSDIKADFAKVSDLDIKTADAPTFDLVDKDSYVNNNIDLLTSKSEVRAKRYSRNMTLSQYLPSVSVNAEYTDRETEGGAPSTQPQEQTTYGVSVSMPLSINSYDDYQRARYDHLVSGAQVGDEKRSLDKEYDDIVQKIELIEEKISLSAEDANLYENLLDQTKDQVYAGNQTSYDLQTMRNSLQIKRLDKKIYSIDKNIQLLTLYIKTLTS